MADKTINVATPTITTDNVTVIFKRVGGVNRCYVEYDPPGAARYLVPGGFAPGAVSDVARLSAAMTDVLATAAPLMRRTDGGDGTGF